MCELFGLSCNKKDRATLSLPVFKEKAHKFKADDGWGIAYYDEKGNVKIVTETKQAFLSERFSKLIEEAKGNIIIAHVRLKASHGADVCKKNCHPFVDLYRERPWVFAHNGTINDIDYPADRIGGETDSAKAFQFMMDNIMEYQNQGRIRGTYPAIMNSIKKVFNSYGKETRFNFLLSDGINLYAFHHYKGKPIYFLRREKNYGGAILLSTRKLSQEYWQKIPEDRLLVISRGEILVLSDRYSEF